MFEWQKVAESVAGSGPLAGALAFALWKMWARVAELEKQLHQSQTARIDDLKSMLKPDD